MEGVIDAVGSGSFLDADGLVMRGLRLHGSCGVQGEHPLHVPCESDEGPFTFDSS